MLLHFCFIRNFLCSIIHLWFQCSQMKSTVKCDTSQNMASDISKEMYALLYFKNIYDQVRKCSALF